MGFRLNIYFSDGAKELVDDVFESEEAAYEEYESWLKNFAAGGETLELAGEAYSDASIVDYDIYEE